MALLPPFPSDALPSACLPSHTSHAAPSPAAEVASEDVAEAAAAEREEEVAAEREEEVAAGAQEEASSAKVVATPTSPPDDEEHIVITSVAPAYEQMTVKELRDLCRERMLAIEGKKLDLVKRLNCVDEKNAKKI